MSSAIDARIAELSARFARQAGEYRAALLHADSAGDRTAIRDRAHKLAGIAPMLGHPDIGAAALALEEAVETQSDYRSAFARLDRLLAALTG